MKKIVCLLFLFSAAAFGQASGLSQQGSKFAAFKAAGSLVPHSFPTKRLKNERLDVKFVPAKMAFSYDEQGQGGRQYQEMDGYGYAAGVTYGLTDQVGLAFLGLGFSMDGKGTTMNATTGEFGANKASGYMATTSLIWDPFKGGEEDFHLPLMAGLSYLSLEETSSISSGTSSLNTKRELNDFAISLGLMAQWTVNSWLRLSPFAFAAEPLSDVSDTCQATGPSASCPTSLQSISKGTEGAGVEVTFRPLNFSFEFLVPVDGMTTYALKLEASF
ncbi:MAG: hypothetical protein A2X86_07140 [Bdellovibrionales bacterium GWA2_49_15]|nr:MAG: hypothetical protein A2X86_07140 [Bdellovibrionales bacterium GWA2_49_15]HAZ11949.1 hypothetical protein [Bdellovibrionales bacterium]